jgi:precorrin-3B synthase
MLAAAQLEALAHAANRFGSPAMELTSRGNIQIRGIRGDEAAAGLADAVASAGLLPSATHERVRNIVASPLSGRLGGSADVRDWVRLLDAAICAEPALADLPGRFWFSLDDGRGDVSGLAADVGAHALGDSVALLLAGRDSGVRIAPSEVVATLISIAKRFVEIRGSAWRVAELADASPLTQGLVRSAEPGEIWPAVTRPPVGWLVQHDGRIALAAAAPLGVLQARVAEYLAAIDAPIVVTPWRSVLVCDIDEGVADTALRLLAPMGLVFDDGSPWLDVSACTGSPGCEHAVADVRADAARAVEDAAPVHRHFVGCERACGSPADGEVLIATADGYVLRTASP